MSKKHWAYKIAERLMRSKPEGQITCAAGISPSGTVHAGNLRELMTSYLVYRAIQNEGGDARLIFSWDDFDRFRKVPRGIPDSFKKFVGMPYCNIPDPNGEHASYAEKHMREFEDSASELGIKAEYLVQSQKYKAGEYDDQIRFSLQKRAEIAEIMARNQSEKRRMTDVDKKNYFPISLYSRFSGNDNVEILDFDGDSKLTYLCRDSRKEDTIDFTKERIVKLPWKIDWPMRWKHEKVDFEPGGADHASPGGSYDVASQIAKEIFGIAPPNFAEYKFVKIKGENKKMSSSKGEVVSPKDLLEIYPPEMVRWFYAQAKPDSEMSIAFDADVIRTFSEFDQKRLQYSKGTLGTALSQEMELSGIEKKKQDSNVSFRQIAGMGDATDFNADMVLELLESSGISHDRGEVSERLQKAKIWMEKYFPKARSSTLQEPNSKYMSGLTEKDLDHLRKLKTLLSEEGQTLSELETKLYAIPKEEGMTEEEKKIAQKRFFGNVYNVFFGKERGPRLPTFVWAAPRKNLLRLLENENL